MVRSVPFDSLTTADLVVDAIYKGGDSKTGSIGDEPINKLLRVGNRGGFRYSGSAKGRINYIVLFTTLNNTDWPDQLNKHTGQFTYYGDNKSPGRTIHETTGNFILKKVFDSLHLQDRSNIPPFFIFNRSACGHDVVFLGVAVPGAQNLTNNDDLVAIWKSRKASRFQNYKSIFTVLDIGIVEKSWIRQLENGNPVGDKCPLVWKKWAETGIYTPLQSENTIEYRLKDEQLPKMSGDKDIINTIYNTFSANPYGFERCAVELVRLMDKNFTRFDLTRPWVDGGRDALGIYNIGNEDNSITIDCALEAKCYASKNSVGVKEVARLISRLRYRQFGILVTTSYVHHQAYKEIIEDGHPILIISAQDIVDILKNKGYTSRAAVVGWLNSIS